MKIEANPKQHTHSWNQENIKKYGNDRCSKCGMQFEYYQRGISVLNSWPNEDKENPSENWNEKIKLYQECRPR